jgi:hypothetical protein
MGKIQNVFNVKAGGRCTVHRVLRNTKHFSHFPPPPYGATAPGGPGPPNYRGFTITLRHTTLGRTPLDDDQPAADTSQETDIHAPGGIQTHNPSKRTALDPRLRPRGHWDRPLFTYYSEYGLE